MLHSWHCTFQIEEEQQLINELRKIEARKKEREKKTQDLQKLINADTDARKITKTTKKKIQQTKVAKLDTAVSKPGKFLNKIVYTGDKRKSLLKSSILRCVLFNTHFILPSSLIKMCTSFLIYCHM